MSYSMGSYCGHLGNENLTGLFYSRQILRLGHLLEATDFYISFYTLRSSLHEIPGKELTSGSSAINNTSRRPSHECNYSRSKNCSNERSRNIFRSPYIYLTLCRWSSLSSSLRIYNLGSTVVTTEDSSLSFYALCTYRTLIPPFLATSSLSYFMLW